MKEAHWSLRLFVEKNPSPPVVDVVRCLILNQEGKYLVLQKLDTDGKEVFEFPGGKVKDHFAFTTNSPADQKTATEAEVEEETNLDLDQDTLVPLAEFTYAFANGTKHYHRRVHVFQGRVYGSHEIILNRSKNDRNEFEDHHQQALWVDKKTLVTMLQSGEFQDSSPYFLQIFTQNPVLNYSLPEIVD